MPPMMKFALPLALLLACRPATAQLMGNLWETNVTLTRADLDLIRAILANQIHGRPAGTSAAWRDRASGNSGKITLLQSPSARAGAASRSNIATSRATPSGRPTASS